MLIYDALKKDHDNLKPLLNQLVASADADDKSRAALIAKIRDELVPHSRAEEAVFYNSLRTIDETKNLVKHGYVEHMEAEALLRTLQMMDKVNVDWGKTARKLKDALEHHIEEEEGRIFEAAQQLLAVEEAEMMADAFQKMKPDVREGSFVQSTLDLIANLMPQRFSATLRSFRHQS